MIAAKTLDPYVSENLQHLIPETQRQARRLVEFLSSHPDATTSFVANKVACSNLSQAARVANSFISRNGYFVYCRKPDKPITNKFGEPSRMFMWGIYSLKAANDENFK